MLADDSVLFREGLARVLAEVGFEIVAQAGDADELFAQLRGRCAELVIVDIRMPPTHTVEGLVAARQIREEHPHVNILVLSQYVETEHALALLELGTDGVGYLLKDRVSDLAAFADVVKAAGRTRGVAATTAPQFLPGVAVAQVYPTGSPQDASTSNLITTLRHHVIPNALHGRSTTVYVGGQTALADDEAAVISSKLPVFVGIVVALSFLLLMVVFRSLLIPATAAVMNLLSAGAAFGVITAVFQKGWLDQLVGVSRTGPIAPLVPILMFAVLFGLSMDYEVFLVSRIHEEWLKTRDNARATNRGQAITGRTITALATIMVVVFAAFTLSTDRTIKMIGLGMATAILIDALIVRTVLVPALMHTFGRANWYLPSWLDRRLPHLELEEKPSTPIEDHEPAMARSA